MCGIVGYVGQRPVQEILLAGLEKLEYRGYDSAGISLQADGRLESVRAVGNLSALRDAVGGARGGRRRRGRRAARDHGHRPHALGHPRPRHRGERPPALRRRQPRPRRRQRDRRELRRAQGGAAGAGRRVHLRDRRRGHRPPDRARARRDGRPHGGRAPRLQPPARPLRVRGRRRRRARPARRRAQGVPADRRPRRRRAVPRLRHPRLPRPHAPGAVHRERRDRRRAARRRRVLHRRRRAGRARRSRRSTGTPRRPRRAATRRSCSRRSTSRRTRSPRRSPTARCAPTASTCPELDDELLRTCQRIVIVACGTSYHAGLIGRYAIEEWARVPVEMDIASEYRYRNPVVGPGDLVDRHHAVRRDGRHAGRDAPGARARRDGRSRSPTSWARRRRATPTASLLHARRPGDLRRRDQDLRRPGRGDVPARAAHGRAARHAAARAADASWSPSCKRLPHAINELLERGTEAIDRVAERVYERGLLPLPRPPRRPAGVPRGRAQAQGDLLHRHRRLRGRRDEARPDRAARRGHAGRRRRHGLAGAREGRSRTCRRSAPAAPT